MGNEETRFRKVLVRYAQEEYDRVCAKAKEKGLPLSTFIRMQSMN